MGAGTPGGASAQVAALAAEVLVDAGAAEQPVTPTHPVQRVSTRSSPEPVGAPIGGQVPEEPVASAAATQDGPLVASAEHIVAVAAVEHHGTEVGTK